MPRVTFTTDLAQRALQGLQEGMTLRDIAADIGVTQLTLRHWRRADSNHNATPEMVEFARQARTVRPDVFRPPPRPANRYTESLANAAIQQTREGKSLSAVSRALGLHERALANWMWQGNKPDAPDHLKSFARRITAARAERQIAQAQATLEALSHG